MAHNLTIDKMGNAEMFYVKSGGTPWHQLGEALDTRIASNDPTFKRLLGWDVDQHAVYWQRPDTGAFEIIPETVVNVRADNLTRLGLVSTDYKVIQNREAVSMMDAIVGEASAMYETAGTLREGRRVFALAKIPRELEIASGDRVKPYLAMILAHDGSHSLVLKMVMTRIVCENTVQMAMREIGNEIRIEHRSGAGVKLDEARRSLGLAQAYFDRFEERARQLTAVKIDEMMMQKFFETVVPFPTEAEGVDVRAEMVKTTALHERLALLFHEGEGHDLPSANGTLWGAVNAVTAYVDHVSVATTKGKIKNNAWESVAFGSGAALSQRAMDVALSMINN